MNNQHRTMKDEQGILSNKMNNEHSAMRDEQHALSNHRWPKGTQQQQIRNQMTNGWNASWIVNIHYLEVLDSCAIADIMPISQDKDSFCLHLHMIYYQWFLELLFEDVKPALTFAVVNHSSVSSKIADGWAWPSRIIHLTLIKIIFSIARLIFMALSE